MDKMTAFTTSNYRLDEQAAELHDAAMTLQTALYGESQLYSLTDLLSDAAREISNLYKANRRIEEQAARQASALRAIELMTRSGGKDAVRLRAIARKGLGNYEVGDTTGYHGRLQRMIRVGDIYSYVDNEGNVTEAPIVYDRYEGEFMHDGVKLSYALKYDDEFHYVKGGETNDNNEM